MGEANVYSLCVSSHPGGYPICQQGYLNQVLIRGYPHPSQQGGYLIISNGEGYPILPSRGVGAPIQFRKVVSRLHHSYQDWIGVTSIKMGEGMPPCGDCVGVLSAKTGWGHPSSGLDRVPPSGLGGGIPPQFDSFISIIFILKLAT